MSFENTRHNALQPHLVGYISTYINLLQTINASLDFRSAKDLRNFFEDDESYRSGIEEYFDGLFREMDKLDRVIPDIQQRILDELSRFKQKVVLDTRREAT